MPRTKITTWTVTVMVFPPPKVEDQGDAAAMASMQKLAALGASDLSDKFPDGKPKSITFERVEAEEITDAMEGGWNLARMEYPNSKVVCLKAIRN